MEEHGEREIKKIKLSSNNVEDDLLAIQYFDSLPQPIWKIIFDFLTWSDSRNAGLVCKVNRSKFDLFVM